MTRRTLIWWSTGAASYVAAKIALRQYPGALVVRCETSNEDPDNYRFEADAMARLGVEVTIIRSTEYSSVRDVWEKRKFIAGPKGAPCTGEMKIAPRLAFQRPDDLHVFGYTADAKDRDRFETLKKNFFELTVAAPLLDAGITKEGTLAGWPASGHWWRLEAPDCPRSAARTEFDKFDRVVRAKRQGNDGGSVLGRGKATLGAGAGFSKGRDRRPRGQSRLKVARVDEAPNRRRRGRKAEGGKVHFGLL